MGLWRHRRSKHLDRPVDTRKGLAGAGYDAQADLASATSEPAVEVGDVVTFSEGSIVEPLTSPAYDVDRDTAS